MTVLKTNPENTNLKLYKYLKGQYARNLMNKGEVHIGTLSYYRDIEDASRADKDEGKKEIVTTISNTKIITNVEEWNKELPHFHNSNINYESGQVIVEKGEHICNDEIIDSYIFCMSKKQDDQLKKKFDAECCIEIFNVQGFLSAIDKELARLGLIYFNLSSGREIEYIGHTLEANIPISGNWLKKECYKDEAEFRFSFIPVMNKNGIRHEPIIDSNKNVSFPRGMDVPQIKQLTIKIRPKEIQKFCRWR